MDYKKEDSYIPVGSADIKEMITQKLYADKTSYITKLFRTNGIYYFFIRPRRFGKSLLLDTIDQIAKCNKELFKSCAIYEDKTYKWKKYPVIWLNFSELVKDSPHTLKKSLNRKLYDIAELYRVHDKIKISVEEAYEDYLNRVINLLKKLENYEPTPIILIDEYDSPLISCEEAQYEEMLAVVSSFFKVLKARQKDCKFIFVTGVTKFYLSGLTSGANSCNDISLHEDYAQMLGYTEEDIDNLFFKGKQLYINEVITSLKENWDKKESYTDEQLKQELKDFYNGYCFSRNKGIKRMYNPDSILKFFRDKLFGNYWSNSGNPAILLQQIKNNIDRFTIPWDKSSFAINQLNFETLTGSLAEIALFPLMYQTGYLTLDPNGFTADTGKDKNATDYYLKFPNQEVQSSLKLTLSMFVAQKQQETGIEYSVSILDTLRNEKWCGFLNLIKGGCLAKAGYRFLDKTERGFQGALYSFLNGVFYTTQGMQVNAELASGLGRLDIALEDKLHQTAYIFELKVGKSVSEALQQIYDKDYSMPFNTCYKKVFVGLKYDPVRLNITEAAIEVHQRDEEHRFQVMPRKNFAVDTIGYFKEVGDLG
ncbi:MAG: ATP-binding protein [Amoebophilaceae bacterium]|nr:ATP-binding protein [Amoebophilaceae bacterium]